MKLESYEKDNEYRDIQRVSSNLELLWRYEPTWNERRNIEQQVSMKEANLPFTLTQGFIAFERFVTNEAEKLNYDSSINNDMFEKIDFISKKRQLDEKLKKDLHSIRRARNKWFHHGVYPSKYTLETLIELLESIDADIYL